MLLMIKKAADNQRLFYTYPVSYTHLDVYKRQLPVSEETCDERYFTTPQRIAQTAIDHTFRTLPPDDEWEVRMISPAQNMSTFLRSHQPWLQVYTGEKLARCGLAVEPVSYTHLDVYKRQPP